MNFQTYAILVFLQVSILFGVVIDISIMLEPKQDPVKENCLAALKQCNIVNETK